MIQLEPRACRLLRETIEGLQTNLEGHLAALREQPQLLLVNEEGAAELGAQLELCEQILEEIRGAEQGWGISPA